MHAPGRHAAARGRWSGVTAQPRNSRALRPHNRATVSTGNPIDAETHRDGRRASRLGDVPVVGRISYTAGMRLTTALALAAIAFTLLLFSPGEIYYSNPFEFPFLSREFLSIGFLSAAAATLAGTVVLWRPMTWLSPPVRERVVVLLVSIAVALWVQGAFVGWNLGPLDGQRIRWEDHTARAWDLVLWVFVLAAPQLFARLRSFSGLPTLCSVVLLAQAASFGVAAVTAKDFTPLKRYRADGSRFFEFSKGRNVLLVVLDEFQCDVFASLLQTDPSLRHSLDGFTYFKNAVAPARQTFPSVPTMLTGIRYDNSVSVPAYLQESFLRHSLFKKLVDHGVRTEVYPYVPGAVMVSPELASNAVVRRPSSLEFLRLFDVGLFRVVPFVLKPHVYRNRGWLTVNLAARVGLVSGEERTRTLSDIKSFRDGLSGATAEGGRTVFKFYHLDGMHVPLRYDENLDIVELSYGRESYLRQATGVLGAMRLLVSRLRELGIYGRSLVVIAGDHGSGRREDLWLQPTDRDREGFNELKARGCPLLLVKPMDPEDRDDNRPLQESSAPVTLLDIPPTILKALSIGNTQVAPETRAAAARGSAVSTERGRPLFSIAETSERSRRYDAYAWVRSHPLYLSPITEYLVKGDVWDDRSWNKGRIFYPPPR